jgi:serine protease AprX
MLEGFKGRGGWMIENAVISSDVVNRILYGCGDRQRYTQETPILVEVWQRYAEEPGAAQDLLITPLESTSAVALLRDLLAVEGDDDKQALRKQARLAPLQSFLAAKLTFRQLIHYLLPRTQWAGKAWQTFVEKAPPDFAETAFRQVVVSALSVDGRNELNAALTMLDEHEAQAPLRGQLLDIARILTLTAVILVAEEAGFKRITKVRELYDHRVEIEARIVDLLKRLPATARPATGDAPLIWRIASNREIRLADEYSRATVKADAAFRLFDVKCAKITWAVIDSGVDRDHPGFYCDPKDPQSGSRVVRTYDFSILRDLLDPAFDPAFTEDESAAFKTARDRSGLLPEDAKRFLRNIYQSYETEMLDWSSIEPLLTWKSPDAPTDGHGTHVAGIIGADMREKDDPDSIVVQGLCPDIRIMDFRIISDTLENTEFAVIAALQLVRYLNSHNQYIVVHGANLSLSIPHVVESFACGRTPVCDECERLVGAGVTVVAAAGNCGYHKFLTEKGPYSGYATLSITDPGNAEGVITVGATHRRDPHTYGISYFSSRGPTGDGRMKPDLVAPGEKIHSTLPNGETGSLDGTSQAAPHVSAAAAMLMARYPELNRDPGRIKRLLCESATDLGRERAFQGHGLLDTLRALQSY